MSITKNSIGMSKKFWQTLAEILRLIAALLAGYSGSLIN